MHPVLGKTVTPLMVSSLITKSRPCVPRSCCVKPTYESGAQTQSVDSSGVIVDVTHDYSSYKLRFVCNLHSPCDHGPSKCPGHQLILAHGTDRKTGVNLKQSCVNERISNGASEAGAKQSGNVVLRWHFERAPGNPHNIHAALSVGKWPKCKPHGDRTWLTVAVEMPGVAYTC